MWLQRSEVWNPSIPFLGASAPQSRVGLGSHVPLFPESISFTAALIMICLDLLHALLEPSTVSF